MFEEWDPIASLPTDRPISDFELAVAVAHAILKDRFNPQLQDDPFQPSREFLVNRLGVTENNQRGRAWRGPFLQANPQLDFRLAEHCWRLVGLGYLVPVHSFGQFLPTQRGREFLQTMDPTAITAGGLDGSLAALGFGPDELPRLYARLAQNSLLAGHYEAAIVMLGVACEALIDELAGLLEFVQPEVLPTLRARPDLWEITNSAMS